MKTHSASWAAALFWQGKLAAALAVGTLLLASVSPVLALSYMDQLVRYPGATRVSPSQLQLDAIPEGRFSEQATFYTRDDFTQVLDWYLRRFRFGSGPRFTGGCLTFTQAATHLFLQHRLSLTLCEHGPGVWISIGRTVGLTAARP
jgi:hypothetical protein